jgi:hypothetical protein
MERIQNVKITSKLGSRALYATGEHRGKTYEAVAICNENDEWNWDLGTQLAMSRLAVAVGKDEIERIKTLRKNAKIEIERLRDLRDELSEELDLVKTNTYEAEDYIEELIRSTE